MKNVFPRGSSTSTDLNLSASRLLVTHSHAAAERRATPGADAMAAAGDPVVVPATSDSSRSWRRGESHGFLRIPLLRPGRSGCVRPSATRHRPSLTRSASRPRLPPARLPRPFRSRRPPPDAPAPPPSRAPHAEEDVMMVNWNGTIIGRTTRRSSPASTRCDRVRRTTLGRAPRGFRTRVNLPCVTDAGLVGRRSLPVLSTWRRQHHRGLPQRALHADAASELQEAPATPGERAGVPVRMCGVALLFEPLLKVLATGIDSSRAA